MVAFSGRRVVAATAVFLCVVVPFAHGQTLQDTEEQRRRPQDEAEQRQRRQQEPEVRLPRSVPALDIDSVELPGETPCFPVQQAALTDAPPESFDWIPAWLARYNGQCLGRKGIELIIRRLSGRLFSDGYITTRVSFPEQELGGGVLRLEVAPGVPS